MIHEILQTLLYSWVLLFGISGIILIFCLNVSIIAKLNIILLYVLNKLGLKLKYIINLCLFNIIFLNEKSFNNIVTYINKVVLFIHGIKIDDSVKAMITFTLFFFMVLFLLNSLTIIAWGRKKGYFN